MTEQTVNIEAVLIRRLGMSKQAVDCVFWHGQVKVGDRTLAGDERVIPYEPVRGQLLSVPGRQMILGPQPAPTIMALF